MILLEIPANVRRTILQDYLKLAKPFLLNKWKEMKDNEATLPVREFISMRTDGWREWCQTKQPEAARYLNWLESEVFSRTNPPDLWDVILCADYSTMCAIICWMKGKNYLYQKRNQKRNQAEQPPKQSNAMDSNVLQQKLFNYNAFREKPDAVGFFATFYNDVLHISVCPYCNINWITSISVQESSDKPLMTAQLDHYFPRSHYPYLGLSLFNLVPSCAVCNQRKTSIDTLEERWLWYPYEAAYCGYMRFQLNLADHCDLSALAFASGPVPSGRRQPSLITVYTFDGEKFKKDGSTRHEQLLTRLYQSHTADVQEIIFRALEFNQSYHKMTGDLLPKRPDSADMEQQLNDQLRIQEQQLDYLLLGEDRQIRMRYTSLGKLKRDIAGQLLTRKKSSEKGK